MCSWCLFVRVQTYASQMMMVKTLITQLLAMLTCAHARTNRFVASIRQDLKVHIARMREKTDAEREEDESAVRHEASGENAGVLAAAAAAVEAGGMHPRLYTMVIVCVCVCARCMYAVKCAWLYPCVCLCKHACICRLCTHAFGRQTHACIQCPFSPKDTHTNTDTRSHTQVISAMCQQARRREALALFRELSSDSCFIPRARGDAVPESIYASLIRVCATPDVEGVVDRESAEALLSECLQVCSRQDKPLRLRVFQPLVTLLFDQGDLVAAMLLWRRMLALEPNLLHNSANSAADAVEELLVTALTALGRALKSLHAPASADSGDGAQRLPPGAHAAEGVTWGEEEVLGWLDQVLEDLSLVLLDISAPSADALELAFARERAACVMVSVRGEGAGACPLSRARLQSLGLSEEQRASVREGLVALADKVSKTQRTGLEDFMAWFVKAEDADGKPFSVIVDAPNVAYSRQNFDGGCFSFHQIDAMVEFLVARGENPLVMMPAKYMKDVVPNHARFTPSANASTTLSAAALATGDIGDGLGEGEGGEGRAMASDHATPQVRDDQASGGSATLVGGRQLVTQVTVTAEQRAITDRWQRERRLASAPFGANDDWYWMAASVATSEGVRVVSNDLMRDHRLALLQPRPFLRWKTTQMLRFAFSHAHQIGLSNTSGWQPPQVTLQDPVPFSVEMQRCSTPDGHCSWHIPIRSVSVCFAVCICSRVCVHLSACA